MTPEPTLTAKDAERLNQQAGAVFTPATPITVRELFAGRTQQLQKMLDAVNQPGLHAVLFGERGVWVCEAQPVDVACVCLSDKAFGEWRQRSGL